MKDNALKKRDIPSLEEALNFYGITNTTAKEIDICRIGSVNTKAYSLNQYGEKRYKKFRTTIDYDSEYGFFVVSVIPK